MASADNVPSRKVEPDSLPTVTFGWGMTKWLVEPATTAGAKLTLGEVVVLPGQGHGRHNHPGSEEILYFLSGEGEQVIDDGEPFRVVAGDTVYIAEGVFHSTMNTGWEPMRALALYNPAGPEADLASLPDAKSLAAGEKSNWRLG